MCRGSQTNTPVFEAACDKQERVLALSEIFKVAFDDSILRALFIKSSRILTVRPLVEELLGLHTPQDNNLHTSYESILATLHGAVHAQSISLLLYEGRQERLKLIAATGMKGSELPEEEYKVNQSISGNVFGASEHVVSNDIRADSNATRKWVEWWSDKLRPNTLRHGMFVPIRGDLELRGVLRFFNRLDPKGAIDSRGFNNDDAQVLEMLATLAAVQLERVWSNDRFNTISHSISSLLTQTTVADAAAQVSRTAARIANGAAAAVLLPDAIKPSILSLVNSYGFRRDWAGSTVPINDSRMGRVITTGKPEEVEDLQAAPGTFNGPGKSEGMASFIALPLGAIQQNSSTLSDGDILKPGILVVYSKLKGRFHNSTIDLLEQFALSAGSVIDNRRRARENKELRQTLAIAAHSVRSRLERVTIALDELRSKDSGAGKATIETAFKNLKFASKRLGAMLNSQKGLIQFADLDMSTVDLGEILGTCVSRHNPIAAERGISVRLRLGIRKFPPVCGDADKLELVFDNLIENAIKYSWDNETVLISWEESGRMVRIALTDRGLGIPESIQDKIFEGFVRSPVLDRKRYISGTGLGLYVSKIVVDAHRGTIEVKSTPFLDDPERRAAYEGYETTFVVSLPVAEGAP